MREELFADGIGEITVTGGIVRLDLVSLSPDERDANNNPKAVLRQRVIMPVDGFANAVDLMQKALAGLVEAGAVRRLADARQDEGRGHRPVASVQAVPRPANSSPNFS
ncbi:hypothetical protein [Lutibaculum baratangense]|uniref:Uncharacterized protein n=1 Tax=Lutibaculum baratangense AMV1 TaxID=631454 RepID=V4RA45_9HYPH|nr:hypothetical protein [Lutibaculum baratangense]ESR23036.1 hypothetical protein N177_3104 [Lutibaculum baratangense AMV1]